MDYIENFNLYITDSHYYLFSVYKYKLGIQLWEYDGLTLDDIDNLTLRELEYILISE